MGVFDFVKKQKAGASAPRAAAVEPVPPAAAAAAAAAPSPSSGAAATAAPPAAAAPPPAAAAATKGAYLVFDTASNGTLFIVWSVSPVEGAMAFFEPKKPVADFKYKDKGGKSEIFRNLSQDKKNYYEGFCQFFKTAAEHKGLCRLLPGLEAAPIKVEVAFLESSSNKVIFLETAAAVSAAAAAAVACTPKGDSSLHVQTLAKDVFVRNARRGGAALIF
ncbi:Chromosome III, complete sequence, related [Eimeria tenella]|uniref:Chromosome III, complete sequence, related n=1 Tax=Eimeria tenella TaxID=5802 RepID=U6KMQ8_EIMTE|nr:Chromosome III, complete sequence, related [Eimeria tenella]CDJ39387.1 Chromosome III, complete sequence, related [Eimeria tenella]|eukprot:XP_013230142.1 Chromosome III, complete sequence, related [Eimeria tenella]